MEVTHSLLQRGRELSVQAKNNSLTDSDRESIQGEIDQILNEVYQIANNTEFNTINLLNVSSSDSQDQQKAVEALKKYLLKNSEALVASHYGLQAGGDDAPLEIQFIQTLVVVVGISWLQGSYLNSCQVF